MSSPSQVPGPLDAVPFLQRDVLQPIVDFTGGHSRPAEAFDMTSIRPHAQAPVSGAGTTFWKEVTELRTSASSRLSNLLQGMGEIDQATREEMGRAQVLEAISDANANILGSGNAGWDLQYRNRLSKATFDALFRLGRLQPLVERTDIDNIEIYGFDRVLLMKVDGTRELGEPVADSDSELIEFLSFLASRDPNLERSFTPSSPFLEMPLPSARARLAAVAWIQDRPRVTIRLQHLQNVTMETLVEYGEIDFVLQHFLTSAVKARKSIVISGQGQGSGKTTMLRALASCLDPWEAVATIETDYELYLHDNLERHKRVLPWQTRSGTGEMTADGSRIGEIDSNALVHKALRHNLDRIIVGEVRGPEVAAMFEAMQMGNGSLSTVHANNAVDVVERLVGLAVKDSSLSETYAYRQIAQSIDLIVFISAKKLKDGRRHRYVSEVIEVNRGEDRLPVAITHIFGPNSKGYAVPKNLPTFTEDLQAEGFDPAYFGYIDGTWGVDLP